VSDRLALAHAIEEAGIERAKAEAVATAIARFVEGSAATKADVQAAEAALKADILELKTAVRTDLTRLDGRIDLVEHRLLTRLGGLMVVLAGLLFAALHAWPPR
jgi:hypothetical protein